MENINNDYKLIPMSEIDDEARKIAVRWIENLEGSGGIAIQQKHKLASDFMNYARRKEETGWISVDDALPKNSTPVLTFDKAGYFCVCWYFNDIKKWQSKNGLFKITHWQQLPPIPTTETN